MHAAHSLQRYSSQLLNRIRLPCLIPLRQRRSFGTSQSLAKYRGGFHRENKKTTVDSQSQGQISHDQRAIELAGRIIGNRHMSIIKASLGIVNYGVAAYNKVIANQHVKDTLIETGRLVMTMGIDITNYSPKRLMANSMVSEQVYKVDEMLDSKGIDPRYMMRAIRIFMENPLAVRVHKATGSGQYFRNSATGETEEIDEHRLQTALDSTKVYRVAQEHPDIAKLSATAGMKNLARNIDPVNPDDTVLLPELSLSDGHIKRLEAVGITPLDIMESTETIQSAMNVVCWKIPESESKRKNTHEGDTRTFQQCLEDWFAKYNRALIISSIEVAGEGREGCYAVVIDDPIVIDYLRVVGEFLINKGIKDDRSIPTFEECRANTTLNVQLMGLHRSLNSRGICPVTLVCRVRQIQKEIGVAWVGTDDWDKYEADHQATMAKLMPGFMS